MPDTETGREPDFQLVSAMFFKKYKDYILGRYRDASDGYRFHELLRSNGFARDLYNSSRRLCTIYDNGDWHSKVLETLDLELIYANVDKMPKKKEEEYTDNLVKELLRYFKRDFFKWCDKPDCDNCGPGSSKNQESAGVVGPNADESKYDCGVVELYKCKNCGTITRFPRYNDPIKLLETRKGRCGEWANLFTLILKSFGLGTRYVWNREDHVWNEYYSPYLERWVHLDSCEQSFDQPYIYAINWNKSMSYCIAYSSDTVIDVSKRYILKNQLPRDQISEDDLQFFCSYVTKQLRSSMSDDELYKLACRDNLEQLEWFPKGTGDNLSQTKTEGVGRQSGSADWKQQRGEHGK
ncbi:PNG1 (YPL096W) [Zygosaccharomyces parabailii]|uniref:Peptide-N(4)-(N-acetyl-beta-glucosaminyl)asparagine amidase n=1 Tax=Zygosaccharomyces bailii (strain CLIB 213 / ATCC 58445 / CBS 680 / BCRC 21525 / NBRC 1098 / NCYC 1416 / NRRL Y-2227) TaxID=1333698 RepID=A0A8J2T8D8_ZYGB2|nr:PNG1 (YPL096W) [Zygosaccharomyces parabailii]CDF90881.1 ZYBA0S08-05402g1_1 [Zygosaccharomyces bailii CLIB 213]